MKIEACVDLTERQLFKKKVVFFFSRQKIVGISILLFIFFAAICFNVFAEESIVPIEKLVEKSELIVVGFINRKMLPYNNIKNNIDIRYAVLAVGDALKGKKQKNLTVRYNYNVEKKDAYENIEPGDSVLLFLKHNNDQIDSYDIVGGSSGIARIEKRIIFHQGQKLHYENYIGKLKELIESGK